ncbi:hypothetical protein ASF43_26925 [Pseudorhodoferax sp. Leaf267]|nr:hypothetical protein ASF43_26925 [Pseudorhodoferax sp. Leaf267]
MQTRSFATALIAAVGCIAATGFAGDNKTGEVGYVPEPPAASSSTLSRADVQQNARQAVRNFNLPSTAEGRDVGAPSPTRSNLTRAQVREGARSAVKESRFFGGSV